MHLPWSKPQQGNLLRLGTAFCQERSLPLRRLARGLVGPAQPQRAPEKRLRRFLGSPQLDLLGALAALLRFLRPRCGPVPSVPVMLDWTYVAKTYALLWAQIPYRGRSFPLRCRVYPATDGNTTAPEQALLQELAAAWPAAAPRPLLWADRGFVKQELLTTLQAIGWPFLIRAKCSLVVSDRQGRRFYPANVPAGATQSVPQATVLGQAAGTVHVVAHTPPGWTQAKERWILVTNLPEALLPEATRLYRHRMQPEQTHRDSKRGHCVSALGWDISGTSVENAVGSPGATGLLSGAGVCLPEPAGGDGPGGPGVGAAAPPGPLLDHLCVGLAGPVRPAPAADNPASLAGRPRVAPLVSRPGATERACLRADACWRFHPSQPKTGDYSAASRTFAT